MIDLIDYLTSDRNLERAILDSLDCPECGGDGFYKGNAVGGHGSICPECRGKKVAPWGAAERLRSKGYTCLPTVDYFGHIVMSIACGIGLGITVLLVYVATKGGIP